MYRIKYLILLLFFMVSIASYSQKQSQDCNKFRTGKFYTITPNLGTTIIERNDSIQVEKNEAVGYYYILKIRWNDDCSYTLTLLENKSSNSNFDPPVENFTMNVLITNVTDSSYQTKANLNGGDYQYGGTIIKIR